VKHDVEKRPKRTVKSYQKERERLEQRSEENPETIKFASQNQFKTYGTLGSNQKVSVKRSEDVQPPVWFHIKFLHANDMLLHWCKMIILEDFYYTNYRAWTLVKINRLQLKQLHMLL